METIDIAKVLLFMLIFFGVSLLVLTILISILYENLKHLNENIYKSISALNSYDTIFNQFLKESAKSFLERSKK